MNESYRIESLVKYDSNDDSKSCDFDDPKTTTLQRSTTFEKEVSLAEQLEKQLLNSNSVNVPNNETDALANSQTLNLHQMCSTFNPEAVIESNSQA
jgi:hypothetical protein